MKVLISFKLDRETLEAAIRSFLFYKKKINKKSILTTVKEHVYQQGISIIDYPEYWGDDLNDIDDNTVENYIKKFEKMIEI